MSDANTELDAAIGRIEALNRAGRAEEALAAARALVESYPDNPRAQFAYGSVLDAEGREAEAVAPYQRALELGLAGDELPRLYVQYGSTLRNLGKAWDAFIQSADRERLQHAIFDVMEVEVLSPHEIKIAARWPAGRRPRIAARQSRRRFRIGVGAGEGLAQPEAVFAAVLLPALRQPAVQHRHVARRGMDVAVDELEAGLGLGLGPRQGRRTHCSVSLVEGAGRSRG